MKKIKFLLILLLIFVGINSVNAFDNTVKVYDYAMVLTTQEENNLKQKVNEYIDKFNMDMVLVTVKYHEKDSTKEYAQDFYDYNKFGLNATYDGIIFVIDFNFGYTDIYISRTGQAIRMYDDYRITSMLDNISLKKDNGYYSMFESFINDASKYASLGIPSSNLNTIINNNGDLVYEQIIPWGPISVTSIVVATIVLLIFIFKNRMVKKSINAGHYLNKDSIIINTRNERFITTHTSSVRINDSSSSGSSGRIGGSSISRGSSGRSHGGGGRRL